MKGLLIKEMYTIKKTIFAILLLGIFYIVMACINQDGFTLLVMMLLILPMFSVTSFYYDDMTKWDKYASALPLRRNQIVLSKYILSGLLMLLGIAYIVVSAAIVSIITNKNIFLQMIIPAALALTAGILFTSGMMPLIYKFGVEKGRIMMVVLAVVFGALIGGIASAGQFEVIAQNITLIVTVAFAVSLILFWVSYNLSVKFYQRKEF